MRKSEVLLASVAYAAIALWWLWPLPLHAASHAAYYSDQLATVAADFDFLTWSFSWGTHALLNAPLRLFDANSFHPMPRSFALSDHCLGSQALFAPAYLVTGNPVLSVNVTIFLTYVIAAIGAYALARRWTGVPAAGLCGLLYAFQPVRLSTIGHFHHLGIGWLPLAILFTERWLEHARLRDAALAGAAFLLQLLTSFYLTYMAVFGFGAYLVPTLIARRQTIDRRRILGLIAILGGALSPVVLIGLPYIRLRRLGLIPSYGDGQMPLGMLFAPTKAVKLLLGDGIPTIALALGTVAVLFPDSRLRRPVVLAVVLAVVGMVMCFGGPIPAWGIDWWTPYRWLARTVPGLDAIRLPMRFFPIAALGLSLLAAFAVERLSRGSGSLAWGIVLFTTAVSVHGWQGLPAPPLHERPVGAALPDSYRWLASNGGGRPLLEFPPAFRFDIAARRLYYSTAHWLPIVDGYSSYFPPLWDDLMYFAKQLPEQNALQSLVDRVDLGWLLVHIDEVSPDLRARWDRHPFGLRKTARWGNDVLYAVTLPMITDRRTGLLDEHRTIGGLDLAPLGPECPGEIRFVDQPAPAGQNSPEPLVTVEVTNRGSRPWPGNGYYPAHLVQLELDISRDGRRLKGPLALPLRADVSAGGTVRASMLLPTLPAGSYEVEARLVQPADGPLEACGVDPARTRITVDATRDSTPEAPSP